MASYGQLAAQLLGSSDGDPLGVQAAYLTAWDPVTYANTVQLGGAEFANLPVLNPASLAIGPVVVLLSPGAPIVLGRIFRFAGP